MCGKRRLSYVQPLTRPGIELRTFWLAVRDLTNCANLTHTVQTCQASQIWHESFHAQIFHTIFYKSTHFLFSCSPYSFLKLRSLQLRFTHFVFSNLAAMTVLMIRVLISVLFFDQNYNFFKKNYSPHA